MPILLWYYPFIIFSATCELMVAPLRQREPMAHAQTKSISSTR
jgi:hypothetical protein